MKDQPVKELVALHLQTTELKSVRKQAEEALRESEQRFKAIFNSALDGICLTDVETYQLYTGNDMFCQILGYNLEEIQKMKVQDIHPKQDLPYILEQFDKQLRGETTLAKDIPMQRKDGSVFYADVNSSPLTIGGKTYLMGIFRDITERRQIERQLKESEERFRQFFENEPEYCYMVSPDGIILDVNKAALNILGYKKEDLVGKPLQTIYAPESLPKMKQCFAQWRESGAIIDEEMFILTKEANRRIVLLSSNAIRDRNGNLLHSVSVQKDITERRHMEEKYRQLLEDMKDGYAVIQDNNVVFANKRLSEIFGYEPGQGLGHNINEFIAPDDQQELMELYMKVINGVEDTPERLELMGVKKDGTIFPIQAGARLIDYEDKPAFSVIIRDITEKKQAEEALQHSEECFQALIENAFDTVMVIAADGGIRYVSPSIKGTLGYKPEEFIGKYLFDFVHPDNMQGAIYLYNKQIQDPVYGGFMELRAKHKDGSWRTIKGTSINLLNNPSVAGIVANFHDITDYRQTEKRYKELIEDINDGYLVFQDEKIVLANQRFAEIFGYTIDQVLGKNFFTFVAPDCRQDMIEIYTGVISGEEEAPERYEVAGIKRDGTKIQFEIAAKSIEYNGKPAFSVVVRDITERKQAEGVLKRGKEHFQALVENAFDTIMIINADGSVRYVSPSIKQSLGYEPEECIGKILLDFAHPDDFQKIIDLHNKYIQDQDYTGYPLFDELRAKHKDGSWRTIEAVSTNLLYHPSVAGIVANFRNITERKEAEEALQHSKEHFQALIENAFDTVMVIDVDGSVRYVSPSIKGTLGYEPEEWIGKNLFDLIPPDNRQKIIDLHNKVIQDPGYTGFMELRAKHKDGSWRTIESISTNLLHHPSVEGIVSNFRDITDYRQKEKNYRDLIEDINDGYIVFQDWTIVLANRKCLEMLGYEPGQVLGQDLLTFVAPNSHQEIMDMYTRFISGKEEVQELYEVEVIKGDGTIITVDTSTKSIEYNGKLAFSVIVRDITERKQAEAALQKLCEREIKLREALEEERRRRIEFTRVLVHELKTPLTPVLAASNLLADEVQDETLVRLSRSISKGALNLSDRINDLLDIVKGEIGTLQLEFQSVDLLPLLSKVVDNIAPMISSNGHSLILDLPQSLPLVWADENRLQQVILNLINNASKFTPSGGMITLRARREDKTLIVEVQDTGDGISEEEQQRIFEPYYRKESDRQRLSGLGLGLALCKTIVELHRGQIWVESRLDEGSTFSFSLPLED